ncbi:hypothetical protein ACTWP5_15765 [Streptomyces sp. 4N509B]|uniref:hypothetical protein n=1 Tax=Streptomyces sp. 4N509B TaxID=3457413 RepID=UPI003FD4C12B
MTPDLPRTIRAVDTEQLLALEREAAAYGFSQRLPVDWLRQHVAAEATHYLFPILVHQLSHRPEVSPQWRCLLLLTVRTSEEIRSLLDVLPDTFDKLPKPASTASRADLVRRLNGAVTQREWSQSERARAERMTPETTSDDPPQR